MFSAKEARQRMRNLEETNELHEIYLAIEQAIARGERQITVVPFCSYLVWDIIALDYGYQVRSGDKGGIISW